MLKLKQLISEFKKSDPMSAKMWLTPDHKIIELSEWHHDWILKNRSALSKKYKMDFRQLKKTDEQSVRLFVLGYGFFRINYEYTNGTLTIEGLEKYWGSSVKDELWMLIAKNLNQIDHINIHLLNESGKIVKDDYASLFNIYNREDKLNNLPELLKEESNKQLVTEGIRNLYHATSINKLASMMKDDAIKLTYAGGTKSDMELNKGRAFYLSTARPKHGKYAKSGGYKVIMNLNGDVIGQNFKMFPINYWSMGQEQHPRHFSEEEERIVSDKSEMKSLKKYVDEVHVFVDPKIEQEGVIRAFHEVNDLKNKVGVPVYFYTDMSAFMLQNKSKSFSDIKQVWKESPPETEDELNYKKLVGNAPRQPKYIVAFVNMLKGVRLSDPSWKDIQKHVFDLLRYHERDAIPAIEADAHNYKTDHPEIFNDLVKITKKWGVKTLRELIKKFMGMLWKPDRKENINSLDDWFNAINKGQLAEFKGEGIHRKLITR